MKRIILIMAVAAPGVGYGPQFPVPKSVSKGGGV
jgi:hypothetical protein